MFSKKSKFDVTLSISGFNVKPKSDELQTIPYRKYNISMDELITHIKQGYVLSSNFTNDYTTTFKQWRRSYKYFVDTSIVMVDIDNFNIPMFEYLPTLKLKPTISYTTFSNIIKGFRFRLLYIFDSPITSIDTYKAIYNEILNTNNIVTVDNCGKNLTQAIIGTNNDAEIVVNDNWYNISNFDLDKYKEVRNVKCIKKEGRKHYTIEIAQNDKDYINDYWNMATKDLIDKYNTKYKFLQSTPLPKVNSDTPYILMPDNYIEIKRYWFKNSLKNNNGEIVGYESVVKKIKDGEKRRYKLFINGIIRRFMIAELTFEHLLHNLVNELYFYINNTIDPIDKSTLYSIACNSFLVDLNNYIDLSFKTDKRKYVINDEYCIKHKVNRKQALTKAKSIITYEQIGSLYDCNLADKENLKVMEENGLKISRRTLTNFKQKFNLCKIDKVSNVKRIKKAREKHYTNEIAQRLKNSYNELYNNGIDYNLEICKIAKSTYQSEISYNDVVKLYARLNKLIICDKSQSAIIEDKQKFINFNFNVITLMRAV